MNTLTRQYPVPRAGIVHLGLGAFSRAHTAIFTEEAIANTGGDWGIVGVSLRTPNVRDALAPQHYVYNAAELNAGQITCRQVEVINKVLVAAEDPNVVVQQMADPAIKVVSLTVTEKGYCLSPATGTLDPQHPDIVRDLTQPLPVSAPGFLVRALEVRKRLGLLPFSVLSCDNLPNNGRVTRAVVLALAEQIDADLALWIEKYGRFPSTMVDRITPATTLEDRQAVKEIIGVTDAAPVMHEPFSQWVVEDDFVNNERPAWASAGAEMVSDVRPYELMKLRMLNGTHSALAYLGYLAGFKTIADTVADNDFRTFTFLLWQKEILPAVTPPPGVSLSQYAENLMLRYENPSIRHLTWQIAMDGSQKLPQRLLGTLQERFADGLDSPGLILSIAAWMRYVGGLDESGSKIDVRDPLAEKFGALAARAQDSDEWVDSVLAMREVFPESIAQALSESVTHTYRELLERGAHEMVRKINQGYRR